MSDIEELLPSLGYFGAGQALSLKILLEKEVWGIRLRLHDPLNQFLNLRSVFAECDGITLDLFSYGARCRQSSFHPSCTTQDSSLLLRGQGIHSDKEIAPWWEVHFNHPVRISELHIENRPDGYGCRSRTLLVSVSQSPDEWQTVYDGYSASRVLAAIEEAARYCGSVTFSPKEPRDALRKQIVATISELLLSSELDIRNVPWSILLQFVPLWTQGSLSDEEMLLVAGMALSRSLRHDYMAMIGLSLCLNTQRDIDRFQSAINELSAKYCLGPWVVTRHGVQQARLLAHKSDYLNAIRQVTLALNKLGFKPVLAYGTLLGAIRDNSFMPHDDDVDLLYLVDAENEASTAIAVKLLGEQLKDEGFIVTPLAPHGLNMHIRCPDSGALIDIFPCWIVQERLHLHMEKMRIRDIDASIVYPETSISLYGQDFAAPANPIAFLAERYGEGWSKSDPYFEWPWFLERE